MGMNGHDLSPMRIAKVVREAFGESAAITCRQRWGHACSPAAYDQHKQTGLHEYGQDADQADNGRDRYQDAFAA